MTKPSEDVVALYPFMLKSGIRLPFQPYIHYILRSLSIAPAKLTPMIYKVFLNVLGLSLIFQCEVQFS